MWIFEFTIICLNANCNRVTGTSIVSNRRSEVYSKLKTEKVCWMADIQVHLILSLYAFCSLVFWVPSRENKGKKIQLHHMLGASVAVEWCTWVREIFNMADVCSLLDARWGFQVRVRKIGNVRAPLTSLETRVFMFVCLLLEWK